MVDPSELRSAVEALLRSYVEHGNINHIDEANLPSRDEVAALLDELIMLIFPGYFAAAHLDALGAPFVVGERCVSLLATLKGAIARALAHAQAEEGPEGKGPRRWGRVAPSRNTTTYRLRPP